MPQYFPIAVDPKIKASASNLLTVDFQVTEVTATFIIPDDPKGALKIQFRNQCIVRLVDEMPLSTEMDDSPPQGLVSEHFAYRVEGALFWRTQSEAFKAAFETALHYRFITGWTCMDVISAAEPHFTVVARS
jgi:hypothetical protein